MAEPFVPPRTTGALSFLFSFHSPPFSLPPTCTWRYLGSRDRQYQFSYTNTNTNTKIWLRPIPIPIPILDFGLRPIPIPIPILDPSSGSIPIPIPILARTPIPQYLYQYFSRILLNRIFKLMSIWSNLKKNAQTMHYFLAFTHVN